MSKKERGLEKLKTGEEKRKREEALLKQTPRLFTYFSSKQPEPDISELYDTDPVVPNKSGAVVNSTSETETGQLTERQKSGIFNLLMTDFHLTGVKKALNNTRTRNLISQLQNVSIQNKVVIFQKQMFEHEKPNKEIGRSLFERIDAQLESQFLETGDYWKKALERVAQTIIFISERCLAFCGSDENVGSNDLYVLKLIARFDPFLSQHIHKYANKEKTLDVIINEVKTAQYYSVSEDSTPNLSHADKLTAILQYVLPEGPVERFLTFISIYIHTGEQLACYLTNFLEEHKVDIGPCRGQSYGNVNNMIGNY
ncbi:unnamed protein product [Lepeophtheirus salmonis]|uniref:(salmon louse) hypothetical protein n=1 Tax=Lepeophtheirus salmonis TaxID=72036 RepID=A0A7R8CEU0_LEPSM|nr:unnamed protein product [Lepeophtheirus salmonis]CAF2798558.1 unnamed protein product [Lepeophtheirus salmonis]